MLPICTSEFYEKLIGLYFDGIAWSAKPKVTGSNPLPMIFQLLHEFINVYFFPGVINNEQCKRCLLARVDRL